MNNKDFLLKLSQQSGNELDATSKLVDSVLHSMVDRLQNGDSVVISGFGSFEVKFLSKRRSEIKSLHHERESFFAGPCGNGCR